MNYGKGGEKNSTEQWCVAAIWSACRWFESIARWRNFEKQLAPLKQALERNGTTLNIDNPVQLPPVGEA